MSLNTAIDIIATQLARQRGRSVKSVTTGDGETRIQCMYRGDEGRMCAVGCLIPDDKYSSDLENWGTVYNILLQGHVKSWTPVYRDHLTNLLEIDDVREAEKVLQAFQYWHDMITFNGDSRLGVTESYSDMLIKHGEAEDEELKALFVSVLTTVAERAQNPDVDTPNVP